MTKGGLNSSFVSMILHPIPMKNAIHILSSISDVQNYIEWRAKYLTMQIDFYCTKDMKKLLLHGIPDNVNKPIRRIDEMLLTNGIWQYNVKARNTRNPIFNITIYSYYPGFKIVQLIEMKRDDLLTVQERQTLTAAWKTIDGIHGSAYERLLTISRTIGRNTEYTSNAGLLAYGPLLNERGNCSGISDSFYLCASLAGLKVGYQYGCSNLPEHVFCGDRHMWNKIYIKGWKMVDVTWNQKSLSPIYTGISFQEARKYYRWNYDLYSEKYKRKNPAHGQVVSNR